MSTMGQTPGQAAGQSQMPGVGSPISNEVYNIITALHSKLEGLEAYRKFSQSGSNPQIWQYLNQVDTQCVQVLTQELERLIQAGQLRPRQPGQTM